MSNRVDTFSKNLNFLMTRNNINQKELADRIGVKKQNVWNYCHARNIPSTETLERISVVFDIPASRFFYDDFEELDRKRILYTHDMQINASFLKNTTSNYPYVQQGVSAGTPILIEGVEELPTISVPDELLGVYARNPKILFMKVNGESMNNVIPHDSVIALYMGFSVSNLVNGDIVVFEHNGEYSLKRFYDTEDVVIFRPDSDDPSFTDIVIPKTPELKIIGKVVVYSIFA